MNPSLGIDTADSTVGHVHALWQLGYRHVIRYCSPDTPKHRSKCITSEEAKQLRSVGLALALVFEKQDTIEGLNETGAEHGRAAAEVAAGLGYGPGSGLFAAVDFDASEQDWPTIADYFTDFRAAIRGAGWLLGCYGPGWVLARLKDAGLIHYDWLPESTGWGGYYDWLDKASIVQHVRTAPVAGLSVDINTVRAGVSLKEAGFWVSEQETGLGS